MEIEIAHRLSVLSHPRRLAIFRLLMRRYPDRVAAGALAEALDLRPSTLSSYLAALTQAGLVSQTRLGTSLRYAVDIEAVRASFDYLLGDCCGGRADLCLPAPPVPTERSRLRVLFVCSANAARSIMAETILRRVAGERFEVFSAGTEPRGGPDPLALAQIAAAGGDTAGLASKRLADLRAAGIAEFDFVFTLCDRAANAERGPWPGRPICAHWGVSDPAGVAGDETVRRAAYTRCHDALERRVRALAALDPRAPDRAGLQRALDAIGGMDE